MNAAAVHQALFWPGDCPVSGTGGVDFGRLAEGLAGAQHHGVARGALDSGYRLGSRRGPQRALGRKSYSCAQHAVVTSRAVETLAVLNVRQRRTLAMHAWLADIRDAKLNDAPGERVPESGRKRLGLRFMEIEALADVLASALPCNGGPGQPNSPFPEAAAVDGLLSHLAGLEVQRRNRLALHALFCELLPAGLGTAAADAALRAAGLHGEVPAEWVGILRFVRCMAEETVRRDVPHGPRIERTGFPALSVRIEPLGADAAARLWLERYRALSAGGGQRPGKDTRKEKE